MNTELIMIGTGSAFPKHSYNSCFAIRSESFLLLVDAGGGNGIFAALQKAGIAVADIHHLFTTHVHTDHVFGAIWLIRKVVNMAKESLYSGKLNIYGNKSVLNTIWQICQLTFLNADYDKMADCIKFVEVCNDDIFQIQNVSFKCFDVGSANVEQTGFRMTLARGKEIVCLGDESLTLRNAQNAANCNILICGAFCRYADKEIYQPYEKHHSTVRDVAVLAERFNIRNLVLIHCEDDDVAHRQELYQDEAAAYYSGKVTVPTDGERLPL